MHPYDATEVYLQWSWIHLVAVLHLLLIYLPHRCARYKSRNRLLSLRLVCGYRRRHLKSWVSTRTLESHHYIFLQIVATLQDSPRFILRLRCRIRPSGILLRLPKVPSLPRRRKHPHWQPFAASVLRICPEVQLHAHPELSAAPAAPPVVPREANSGSVILATSDECTLRVSPNHLVSPPDPSSWVLFVQAHTTWHHLASESLDRCWDSTPN